MTGFPESGPPDPEGHEKILVGVISCPVGERVRFDGGHKQSNVRNTSGQCSAYRPFCPEMALGPGIPRETIRLVSSNGEVQAVSDKSPGKNYNRALLDIAEAQKNWQQQIPGYIVSKDSPSCGMERVRVYHQDHPGRDGTGLYTRTLMRNLPTLPVEEEGGLRDPVLRASFVKRGFVNRRWQSLLADGLGWAALTVFHARHKLMLYSHHQELGRKLGRELSRAHQGSITDYAPSCLAQMMSLLKVYAKRSNHVNVLQHIQGYLKQDLDKDDKRELTESIENCRRGLLPLIVPITLLRHHFRRNPNPYIDRSYYIQPHPDELMLLNSLKQKAVFSQI